MMRWLLCSKTQPKKNTLIFNSESSMQSNFTVALPILGKNSPVCLWRAAAYPLDSAGLNLAPQKTEGFSYLNSDE